MLSLPALKRQPSSSHRAERGGLSRRLHLVLPLRACRCLKTFSPPDSPSFLPVGRAAGVEGRLVRGAAALPPPVCADLSPKNLFASLRRPLSAGVFAFASLILLVVLPRSSPICCPRRWAGTPALLCALFVAISLCSLFVCLIQSQ